MKKAERNKIVKWAESATDEELEWTNADYMLLLVE